MALNVNAGFTAPIMMALGGWKRERMMRRYAAVTDKTLRRPLRQWRETVTTQSTN